MRSEVLEKFVGQMTVADFCAKLGCSVEELVERAGTEETTTRPARDLAKPEPPESSLGSEPLADLMTLPMKQARAEFEQRYLRHVLEACSGNRIRASRRAGISRSVLYTILNRSS